MALTLSNRFSYWSVRIILCLTLSAIQVSAEVKWCAQSGKTRDGVTEMQKCSTMIARLNTLFPARSYTCVEHADCNAAIQTGAAHLYTIDGGSLYSAHKWGGVPIVAEAYSTTSLDAVTYYSVAVVHKSMCSETVTLESLKGMRSCHTGYRKSAGWRFPITTLMKKNLASVPVFEDCTKANDIEVAESFFAAGCAPGVGKSSPLCSNCAGAKNATDPDSEAWCKKNVDPYAGYGGAFKCLAEGNGDVAFIKHTTIDLEAAESWFQAITPPLQASDFKLLCRGGGCKERSEYQSCHLAKVPAHTVTVNPKFVGSTTRSNVASDLVTASADSAFASMFFSGVTNPNPGSLIFKSGTKSLISVVGQDAEEFMGDAFENYAYIDVLENSTPQCPTTTPQTPTTPNTSPTNNAIPYYVNKDEDDKINILIGVCVAIGLLLIAVFFFILYLVGRERSGTPLFKEAAL